LSSPSDQTERLYWEDPLLLAFTGTVTGHGELGGRPTVILDRSAFYPESGGQMADRGELGGRPVLDVQQEGEAIHHLLGGESPMPAIGERIEGRIEETRRRTHMALHSGQHLLSRALFEVAGAETLSSRLGERQCTLDLDKDDLSEAELAEAEARVNALIDLDLPVRASFPSPEELAALPLRSPPKAEHGRVRIVTAGGFDHTPCGGTHVLSTAQIGLLRIRSFERYKGGTRILFSAGPRAREELLEESRLLRSLCLELTCGAEELAGVIRGQREKLEQARRQAGALRAAWAKGLAEAAREEADEAGRVRLYLGEGGADMGAAAEGGADLARQVAAELTREGSLLAIVAGPGPKGTQLIVARGPDREEDVRPYLKRAMEAEGGRGGGRPQRAEGKLPEGADVEAALEAALATARTHS
jgi:alanyl-tRNA synthetase